MYTSSKFVAIAFSCALFAAAPATFADHVGTGQSSPNDHVGTGLVSPNDHVGTGLVSPDDHVGTGLVSPNDHVGTGLEPNDHVGTGDAQSICDRASNLLVQAYCSLFD